MLGLNLGDRVLYRYSPAGLSVYGAVIDIWNGVAAVRTNIENPSSQSASKSIVMYRKVQSWEVISDKSPLHNNFTQLVTHGGERLWSVKQLKRLSVTSEVREKLMDMSRV